MATRTRIDTSATALWASAFVILALVILQAGRLPSQQAFADQATARGPFTIVTANGGTGGDADPDELLYVLNSRYEVLMVYEVEDARQQRITLRDGGSLRNLFRAAP